MPPDRSGFLAKRGREGADGVAAWRRRWFELHDGALRRAPLPPLPPLPSSPLPPLPPSPPLPTAAATAA